MTDLFRREAVEFQAARLQGEVIVGVRSPWLVLGCVSSGLVIIMFLLACFATYTRKEIAPGALVSSEGITRLVSPWPGMVEQIFVTDGEEVGSAQKLVQLRGVPELGNILQKNTNSPEDSTGNCIKESTSLSKSTSISIQNGQANKECVYTINSPSPMIVGAIPVRTGQPLSAGDTVAMLIPKTGRLEAELYVPTKAVGFLKAGQVVSLQYEAFSHRKFGSGIGKIISVSQIPLMPKEMLMLGRLATEPAYRARVSLDHDYIVAYGEKIQLHPGMLLSAEITIEQHSLVKWLLDPLYALGKR